MSESPDITAGKARVAKSGKFLEFYKRGQGIYTRSGTAIGAGILLAGMFQFIYQTLSFDEAWTAGLYLRIGIPMVVCLTLALMVWWVVGVNRRTCDFMIQTDGEMKKVNWSTQKEIVASTKVVIVVTLLMATALFVVDWAFMNVFQAMGVLRAGVGGGS